MAIKTKPTGPLNYTALSEHLAAETGTSVDTAKATVTALLDIVARTVADGHPVTISNFGAWLPTERPARAARNPHTGETMHLPASRAVRFRVSPASPTSSAPGTPPQPSASGPRTADSPRTTCTAPRRGDPPPLPRTQRTTAPAERRRREH
ncbi:Integration host factor subunit alpha [Streptomyces rimosus subsp. rimosus]